MKELEPFLNKIIQGDCLEVMKRLPDNCVDLIVTSPPYNKGKVSEQGSANWKQGIDYDNYEDNLPEEEYQEWQIEIINECLRILKPTGSIFYNHKPRQKNHKMTLPTEWLKDFDIRQVIFWHRGGSPDISPICFMKNTEWIIWIKKQIPTFNPEYFSFGEVWRFGADMSNDHPAPFPEELPERCILATTREGDTVFDPFSGSGTTSVVSKRLGRNFIGTEISQKYVDIANERLSKMTGNLF